MGDNSTKPAATDIVFPDKDSDATAHVIFKNGVAINISNGRKEILNVPLTNGKMDEADFKKVGSGDNDVYFDKAAMEAFLKDPKHKDLIARLEAKHVVLPAALGYKPLVPTSKQQIACQ